MGVRFGRVRCGLLVAALMAGCAQGGDGRFVGEARTEQGACGPGFDDQGHAEAILLVRGVEAKYVPSGGVLVLSGQVDAAGHIRASSVAPGADKKPFAQVFEGVLEGGVVTGRYATPRCRAVVELRRR